MAAAQQANRHVEAHAAESDETDVHEGLLA
jgi:hypothetical protein